MGSLLINPSSVPVSVTADWQPLLARDSAGNFGLNMITLTNWDTSTTEPQVAGGSKIDIMGSIASFPADEAIGGAPTDGTVWLRFVVNGTAVTAEWTNTAPAWDAGKGQWANGSNVYSGHRCYKTGAAYYDKNKIGNHAGGKKDVFSWTFTGTATGPSESAQVPFPIIGRYLSVQAYIRNPANVGVWFTYGNEQRSPSVRVYDSDAQFGQNIISITSGLVSGDEFRIIMLYSDER